MVGEEVMFRERVEQKKTEELVEGNERKRKKVVEGDGRKRV